MLSSYTANIFNVKEQMLLSGMCVCCRNSTRHILEEATTAVEPPFLYTCREFCGEKKKSTITAVFFFCKHKRNLSLMSVVSMKPYLLALCVILVKQRLNTRAVILVHRHQMLDL